MNINDIKQAKEVYNELGCLCRKYFETHYDTSWQHYCSWEFLDDVKICITYTYTDYSHNTDMCTEIGCETVYIEELIKLKGE